MRGSGVSVRTRLAIALAFLGVLAIVPASPAKAQTFATENPVLQAIWEEGRENSHVYDLAQTLMDVVGPRVTGTPGLDRAHLWVEEKYRSWGIEVEQQEYGTWEGWESGLTHVDLVAPRRTSLVAHTLAWSPGTDGVVEAPVVILPEVDSPAEFREWVEAEVPGAFVLTSFPQPTCRPDEYWERHGSEASVQAMRDDRESRQENWQARVAASTVNPPFLPAFFEQAGAAGILMSTWAGSWGTNRVFLSGTRSIPSVDLGCEDYGMLARLAQYGHGPEIRVDLEAEFLGETPTFNTVGMIPGSERPDEYVMLSAHLDTWGGATGATDNGTGTVVMMEAMRILREVYPNPRRTILAGHWGGEEQGLNGSAAFAEDNPEILDGMQILMNQDNGTGRVTEIDMQGFLHAGPYFGRWLAEVPSELAGRIELGIPGLPDDGRSDHASFVCHGLPAFRLGSHEWDYRDYTWHTTRDTFDKIAFEEVEGNAILTAMLAYLASEEPELMSREQRLMPVAGNGERVPWPSCGDPMRAMP